MTNSTHLHKPSTKQILWTLTVSTCIVLIMMGLQSLIGVDRVERWMTSLGERGPIGLILRKILTVVFPPLSGTAAYIFAGGLFGKVLGLIYVTIGDVVGMSIAFWLARRKGHQFLRWFLGKRVLREVDSVMHYLDNKKTYIVVRFLLFRLEDLLNFAAGLSKMSFWFFLPVSTLISVITSLPFVFLGNQILH